MPAAPDPFSVSPVWRALVHPPANPYDGMDFDNARRTGAVVWVLTTLIALIALVAAPPTELGTTGWLLAGATLALWVVGGLAIVRRTAVVTPNRLMVMLAASLVQTALLEWLAGGYRGSYGEIYVLLVAYAACWPPRRVVPFFLALPVTLAAPLAYDGVHAGAVAACVTRLLTLYALAFLVFVLMTGVRATRMRLRKERERADELARIDGLTGLGNRRACEEFLEATVSRCERSGAPFTIAMLDLDGFKAINDSYGHDWGDVVLRRAGTAIRDTLRVHDACFRWGGDEFVVVLPDTERAGAEQLRERLEAAIRAHCTGPAGEPVTLSCGLTDDVGPRTATQLLGAADREMLARKGKLLRTVAAPG